MANRWRSRPTYKGKVIPWVARRAGRRNDDGIPGARMRMAIDPATEETLWVLDIPGFFRDDQGWLWAPDQPEALNGRPEFAQINITRQRRCMDEKLCQVCGESAINAANEVTFVIPRADLEKPPIIASQAPVCLVCIPIALDQCPHLRQVAHAVIAAPVDAVVAVAVIGDVYDLKGKIEYQGIIPPRASDGRSARTLARQRVVAIKHWRIVFGEPHAWRP